MRECFIAENTEYALRYLLYLTPYGKTSPISEVAGYMQVPSVRLRPVSQRLKSGVLIKRGAGARDGYQLAKKPERITLYEVLRCAESYETKSQQNECAAIEALLSKAQSGYIEFLKQITLKDLCGLLAEKSG